MTAPLPRAALDPVATRVFLALNAVYARDGRATIRGVAAAADLAVNRTQGALVRLRNAELVAWTPRASGTLRPLFAPLAHPT